MNNREVYEKDPSTNRLLNNGVAKVSSGQSDSELDTLRYEVGNFVCDGQYADGLARVLSTYLDHLDKAEQPGVWVSGFFGSGKSHLVKLLQHLWIDYEFPDKAKARGLAKLPEKVRELLTELSNRAKRFGGLHAAAGTLGAGAGDSVRLEVMRIIFTSVGLPEDFARANFVMWLRHEKLEGAVRKHVEQAGRDYELELANLYVSDAMAKAVLAARPDFAQSPADVKLLLEKQFPEKADVSIDDMVKAAKRAVAREGKPPCTLLVLDEVQQYIGDSVDRAYAIDVLQRQFVPKMGATLIVVATGQNALSGIPLLQKIQGDFPVAVELQDTDVEQVTREVVLKKKATAETAVKKLLGDHSGEIERQLAGSKIAFVPRDRVLLVPDYPILPVRRRFWEKVLRAVDKAGTGAQLRTQLWIVYDAVQQTADKPLGTVIGGAFLFEHIKTRVLQSGVLLQELSETIARQKQEEDGDLRYQICALIFLIGQLPHTGPADAGIRANPETLADLLVTDLTKGSSKLRKRVPELLDKLVASGAVMLVEDEYRMQTREGAEWNQAFHEARNKLLNEVGKLAGERSQLLKSQCGEILKKAKLLHGTSKEARKFDLHFGADAPPTGGNIPVWVRDGWDVPEKTVLADARAAGDAAAVFGFVPKRQDDELKQAVASYYAATATIQGKGTPTTPEGMEARKAMETRQEQALRTRDGLINDILNETAVYMAGGDPVAGVLLEAKVLDGVRTCLDRLYSQFHQADSADWHKVIERSRKGDGDALAAVSHKGDPESHPVSKAVLAFVGSGKKGTDIRKQFGGPPYGWPQDAVDAALIVLTAAGSLQARTATGPVGKGGLDQKNIAAAEFRVESITLTTVELIALRTLFKKGGFNTTPGQESAHAAEFLAKLVKLAEEAGGDPPLPKQPGTTHLSDLAGRVGNDQLKAIHDAKDRLGQEVTEWQLVKELITKRFPRWRQLTALLHHAADLPVAAEVRPEVEAVEANRTLLADPDPVPGLVGKLADALRVALKQTHSACTSAHDAGMAALDASLVWQKLLPQQRYDLLTKNWVRTLPTVEVGTTEEILGTLGTVKLNELRAISHALPGQFSHAVTDAAKLLEPKAQTITLPSSTVKDEAELQAWLDDVKARVLAKLKEGPVIL
ncbi:MAG: BREX system P-loop protein BrxC [Planctomycetaceae bacterium]|nr:BREX system P-loop protein BrxC [Planctomycetaceae bacterium]